MESLVVAVVVTMTGEGAACGGGGVTTAGATCTGRCVHNR